MSQSDHDLTGVSVRMGPSGPAEGPESKDVDEVRAGFDALRTGRFDEAVDWFERALQRHSPGEPDVMLHLAEARLWQGRFDETERLCREILERDGGCLEARGLLGVALAYEGDLKEAIRFLAKAPDHPAVHLGRALALDRLGEWSDAETSARRALQLDPDDSLGHHTLGTILAHQRRYVEALAAFDRATELNPKNEAVHDSRKQLLISLGQPVPQG
jgi:cytochrome c-type biogenesis protein CcmH/NrfG